VKTHNLEHQGFILLSKDESFNYFYVLYLNSHCSQIQRKYREYWAIKEKYKTAMISPLSEVAILLIMSMSDFTNFHFLIQTLLLKPL
jgi:hypothetical protein